VYDTIYNIFGVGVAILFVGKVLAEVNLLLETSKHIVPQCVAELHNLSLFRLHDEKV
jgi:hypothetical protein